MRSSSGESVRNSDYGGNSGNVAVESMAMATKCQAAKSLSSKVLWTGLWCGLYFGIGCAFYMTVEPATFDTVWKALYFLMVTASTVGYGDMNPTNLWAGSQVFTIVYIFLGIGVVFAHMSDLISVLFKPLFRGSRAILERIFPQQGIDIDGDGTADFKVPRGPWLYFSKNLSGPILIVVAIQCLFAAVFCAIEGWDFGTAMYHCLVTATTVGYGDISIETDGGRMWAFVHIAISVALLATVIGDVGELSAARSAALHKVELLRGTLDTDLMKSLDTDGDGVDKFEFVIGMLAKLNMINVSDVEAFSKLFESMDADGSGKLTADDLDAMKTNHKFKERSQRLSVAVPPSNSSDLKALSATLGRQMTGTLATFTTPATPTATAEASEVKVMVQTPEGTTTRSTSMVSGVV